MARLSAAEAKALGITTGPSAARKRTKPAGVPGGGRDRAGRVAWPGEEVDFTVRLPFDPRPKERPRTVAALDGLKPAFFGSGGSADAFSRMAGAALSRAFRSAGGRFEVFLKELGGGSRTYTPKATADYEGLLSHAARAAMRGRPPMECPVETDIFLQLAGDPSVWPTSRLDGDADNLEKAVLDAMNGIVFADDRLVVRSVREKACGPDALVRVRVRPAGPSA